MKRSEFVRMFGGLNQTMRPDPQSGINPYTGPWTSAQVIHLLRRATFGREEIRSGSIVGIRNESGSG
ncbi:MAG: hypothetical protein IPG87_17925 [Saprospiraceae bacterium]|nr:hypothetical protein [Candidatus Vicinibacter affinis]